VAEVRSTFTKNGGSMASAGAVSYIFSRKGQIEIEKKHQKLAVEKLEEVIIESGASDFETEEGYIVVYTDLRDLAAVKDSLEKGGVKVKGAELTYVPKTEMEISDAAKAKKVLSLVDSLEEIDDITNVHTNLDVPRDVLEQVQ
jgi:transcriptional/translational regulatory protein YebC/TACO1